VPARRVYLVALAIANGQSRLIAYGRDRVHYCQVTTSPSTRLLSTDNPAHYRVGIANEERALRLLYEANMRHRMPWFLGADFSTRSEDRAGIDIWVRTADLGRLPLQIKSSYGYLLKSVASHGSAVLPIGVLVVNQFVSDAAVIGRLLGALILLREDRLAKEALNARAPCVRRLERLISRA